MWYHLTNYEVICRTLARTRTREVDPRCNREPDFFILISFDSLRTSTTKFQSRQHRIRCSRRKNCASRREAGGWEQRPPRNLVRSQGTGAGSGRKNASAAGFARSKQRQRRLRRFTNSWRRAANGAADGPFPRRHGAKERPEHERHAASTVGSSAASYPSDDSRAWNHRTPVHRTRLMLIDRQLIHHLLRASHWLVRRNLP